MNCRPGDLAIITQCPPVPDAVGKIVQCVVFHGIDKVNGVFYPDVWQVDWGGQEPEPGVLGWGCPDAWMRPIRDPGDDAVDETLRERAVPCEA